jgi:hypothetical protein
MKKILLALTVTALIPFKLYAQDEITVDELLGNDNQEEENVQDLERERTEGIENELNISVPEYTDNPSHIVTFVDPSEEKIGVEIDIDESGYKEIVSPYALPSLAIGEHRLKFRFVDSIGATKVLEYDIVIIPRPPIIKLPSITGNELLLSGTGLANSEAVLAVSVGVLNYTQIADIDGDGNWSTSITLDSAIEGVYTIWGYTRKDGYASNPSEPSVMEYGDGTTAEADSSIVKDGIYFRFKDITVDSLPDIVGRNPDLLITVVSALLLGSIVTSVLFLITRSRPSREERDITKRINGKPKEEKTLMELFEEEKKDGDEKQKEKDKKKEPKKDKKKQKKEKNNKDKEKGKEKKVEKVFTKTDFLKDFKDFDPDTKTGEEKKTPSKKDKKDVIITLTSKVED